MTYGVCHEYVTMRFFALDVDDLRCLSWIRYNVFYLLWMWMTYSKNCCVDMGPEIDPPSNNNNNNNTQQQQQQQKQQHHQQNNNNNTTTTNNNNNNNTTNKTTTTTTTTTKLLCGYGTRDRMKNCCVDMGQKSIGKLLSVYGISDPFSARFCLLFTPINLQIPLSAFQPSNAITDKLHTVQL